MYYNLYENLKWKMFDKLFGKFTYRKTVGRSVVGYVITLEHVMLSILSLEVSDYIPTFKRCFPYVMNNLCFFYLRSLVTLRFLNIFLVILGVSSFTFLHGFIPFPFPPFMLKSSRPHMDFLDDRIIKYYQLRLCKIS